MVDEKPVTKNNQVFPKIVREIEEQAQQLGAVVTFIKHPLASGDVFDGAYSGIRTEPCKEKEAKAQLSNGKWIDI